MLMLLRIIRRWRLADNPVCFRLADASARAEFGRIADSAGLGVLPVHKDIGFRIQQGTWSFHWRDVDFPGMEAKSFAHFWRYGCQRTIQPILGCAGHLAK